MTKKKAISSKAALVVLALLAVLLVDNVLGFSYSYSLTNKVNHIQKLNAIISDSTSDKSTINYAMSLRKDVFVRKNILENVQAFVINSFKENSELGETHNSKINQINPNVFLFHVTSSGSFYLVAIFMFPVMLFVDRTSSSFSQKLVMSLFLFIMFAGIGIFFYWICSLIPMILTNSWILNYICNLLIQGLFIYIIFKFAPN